MITVKANLVTHFIRLLSLACVIGLLYIPISRAISGHYPEGIEGVFYFFILLFLSVFICLVFSLLGVYFIEINCSTKIITLKKAFKKHTIQVSEIEGYYLTKTSTRFRAYQGIILQLRNGKKIELLEYNLASLFEFNQYLIEQNAQCLGWRKSWFPFSK